MLYLCKRSIRTFTWLRNKIIVHYFATVYKPNMFLKQLLTTKDYYMKKHLVCCLIILTSLPICAGHRTPLTSSWRAVKIQRKKPYINDNRQEARQRASAICQSCSRYTKFLIGSIMMYSADRWAIEHSLQSWSFYHNTTA